MSLRARLLAAVGAVALVALVVADFVTYSSLHSFLIGRVDQGLQAAYAPVQGVLSGHGPDAGPGGLPPGPPGSGLGPDGQGTDQPTLFNLTRVAPGTFVEVRAANGTVRAEQPAYLPGGTAREPNVPAHIAGLAAGPTAGNAAAVYFDAASTSSGGPDFRVRASRLPDGSALVLAVPLSDTEQTLHRLLFVELAVTGGALILAGLIGWWLVRLGFRPLAGIERTAGAIADGQLGHRVPGASSRTEVGRLAATLNKMLERIEGAFAARDETEGQLRRSEARLRRFVADASHELRTPVAAVSAYAELFERGAESRPEDLARVMSGIRIESARMGSLVEDLVLLARMDEGRPLDRVPVELVAVAAEAVDASRAVGPDWPVRLEASGPVEVIGDRARLRQVIDNLLVNVRAHTPPGTAARVRLSAGQDSARIDVEDDGPGIDPDDAQRIFERFYRSDPSRSRSSGGAGLGLSIVGAIVAAHGGTAEATRRPGGGSVFSVLLPLAPS